MGTKEVRCKDDVFTHLYTLIVNPDGTYEVLIDNESAQKGSIEDDWDILPDKMIKDPEAKKPEDWDDRAKIDDAEDIKPEDWEQPEHVADPDATKPEDWDDEMDGEWEPPIIDNVLITDDVAEAKKIGDETWGATKDPEKAMKDSQDEEEKAKAEAEAAAAGAGGDAEEDEDIDDEDLDDIDDEEEPKEEHDEL